MGTDKGYDWRQLSALGMMAALVPSLRVFLTSAIAAGGRAAWLSALLALPPMLLYLGFLNELLSFRRPGEALPELILRCLGRRLGKAALILSGAWMLLYAGFVLRSGADRLIVTIYPKSSPGFFVVVMGLAGLAAALTSPRTIVRSALLFRSLVLGALAVILVFAGLDMDFRELWPLSYGYLLPALKGSWAAVDVLVFSIYAPAFLCGPCPLRPSGLRAGLGLLIKSAVLMALVCAVVCGALGPELAGRLSSPFFAMVRNLVFFRTLERMEALAVMLWVFPDFLLVGMFLWSGQHCLRLALGMDSGYGRERGLGRGRYIVLLSALASLGTGLLLAHQALEMERWSMIWIPGLNLVYGLVLLPTIYITGRLTKRL